MQPGAPRTGSVLHAGTETGFVRDAVADVFGDDVAVTVESVADADEAVTRLDDQVFDAVVVETGLGGWADFVADVTDVPVVVLARDPAVRGDAVAAGADDVFVRYEDESAVFARRLENVLSADRRGAVAGPHGGTQFRAEREFSELLLDTIDDVFYLIDPSGQFRRWNDALPAVTGYSDAEIADMSALEFFAAEDHERIEAAIEEVRENGSATVEAEMRTRDGEGFTVEISGARLEDRTGDLRGIVGIARDVTERKELESELREQANLLDHIFNQVPSALYVKDEEARYLRKRNFEDDPDEFVGKTDVELFGDIEYARRTHADDLRVIQEGERIINEEEYNPLNDEWVLTSKVPWRDGDGEIRGLIGVSRFITEKKEYEAKLKLRNRAIEEAPIGITIGEFAGDERSMQFVNAGFAAISGYDRDTLEGGDIELLRGPETDEAAVAALENAFAADEEESVVTVLYRRDGTPFWARVSVAPVTREDGETTHFVGFLQDVTDEKEHEQEIERRLDEFGDILAEELRAPLQTADSALETARDDDATEQLESAQRSIRQADKLVEDLAAINSFSVKSREVSETLSARSEDGE